MTKLVYLAVTSLLLTALAQAASVDVQLEQSKPADGNPDVTNLTAEGNLDWGTFTGDGGAPSIAPAESKLSGSGFVSLTTLGTTANTNAVYGNSTDSYTWSDGTTSSSGSTSPLGHDRLVLNANGDGTRLSVSVSAAGTYRLKFYSTTYNVGLSGTATLTSDNTTDTEVGTDPGNALGDFYWTVLFTTDGPDTLNLDVVKNSGSSSIYSIKAFSFSQIVADADLDIAAATEVDSDLQATTISIPFQNNGLADLTITDVTASGADVSRFSVQSFTNPVASGQSGTIELSFTPDEGQREYQATFAITSNDPDSPANNTVTVSAIANQLGKVLCVGDSITEGRNGTSPAANGYSWRYYLWQRFVDLPVGHQFVGTLTSNKDGSVSYPLYNGKTFTNRHEAIWGTSANERESVLDTRLNTLATANETPDTVFIFVGGNGVSVGPTNNAQITNIASDINSMIDMVQGDVSGVTGNPNVTVYLISILPRFGSGGTPDVRNAQGFAALNTAMKAMPAAQTTATSKVQFLDVFDDMNLPIYYYDGVHPSGSGADRLAGLLFDRIIKDHDGDTIADAWENFHFGNLDTANFNSDKDNDGTTDRDEYHFGMAPQAIDAAPPLDVVTDDSSLHLTLPSATGDGYENTRRTFRIFSSSDLEDWTNVLMTGIADGNEVTLPIDLREDRKFYRYSTTVK